MLRVCTYSCAVIECVVWDLVYGERVSKNWIADPTARPNGVLALGPRRRPRHPCQLDMLVVLALIDKIIEPDAAVCRQKPCSHHSDDVYRRFCLGTSNHSTT